MWSFTADPEEFAGVAERFLLGDPVGNNVLLTVLAQLRAGMPAKDASFGWWRPGGEVHGEVCGAVLRTPPRPLELAHMPVSAIEPLVAALDGELPQVLGPAELTAEFTRLAGRPWQAMSERLYRLGTLVTPDVPGHGRPARSGEFSLLVSWWHGFAADAGVSEGDDLAERVLRRLQNGELFVWEHDGLPVSVAALHPAAAGVCRIGPVYTPRSCRRRGFGAAVTAYASQVGLAERCEQVVLFADLANPTSNRIYQSIGFAAVSDYAHVTFTG
ncbi:GNAT family N-acetyltransferase [Nonomuraea sp. NN258]|uniref:GNAT family N-acetyltransferase n=1 Tax=Nonomuraea antri TaxID=2730852 RepID=UPI0015680E96|nr:GNAT family N-acetyltransferase [Nonomuraea antri]NRQ35460.1 GNAT family N-acetyltransferase [Nonomuraea antri]